MMHLHNSHLGQLERRVVHAIAVSFEPGKRAWYEWLPCPSHMLGKAQGRQAATVGATGALAQFAYECYPVNTRDFIKNLN